MKFINAGTYDGNPESLPQRTVPGAVQFQEFENMKKFSIIMNILSVLLMLVLLALAWLRSGDIPLSMIGLGLGVVSMVPHEFLHACCFRGEVKMYSNFKQGMMFVIGTEDMSRTRFVLMSMLPNIVFGIIPYLIYMIFPHMTVLGTFGVLGICAGAGDYYNVFNCLTQAPKGAKVFNSGIHTFWYRSMK